jgi:hypothetical protein
MILYVPNNMHSFQLSHICNKEVSLRPLHEAQQLQIKILHAVKQHTQGWILEKYARKRYLLPRYQW